jgi:Pentapeptide repeats (8 copies)
MANEVLSHRQFCRAILGGAVLAVGLYFTLRRVVAAEETVRLTQQTLAVSRSSQTTERFAKAVEQLGQTGPETLTIRLGGIYTLEQIARDSPDQYHWPIMELLTAYIREHAPWREPESPPKQHSGTAARLTPKPSADIQAILTVLGRRTPQEREKEAGQVYDLRGADLRGADLRGAHLEGASLDEAHLEGASLRKTHLEGASLRKTHLEGAILEAVHLEGASLNEAHLEGAYFWGVYLEGANLTGRLVKKVMRPCT